MQGTALLSVTLLPPPSGGQGQVHVSLPLHRPQAKLGVNGPELAADSGELSSLAGNWQLTVANEQSD